MEIKLYGAALSPFVRKTRVALALKGVEHEMVYTTPVDQPEGYADISPMRRIPAMTIDGQPLADSAAICTWLEKVAPEPALYPEDAYPLARTVWFERHIDYDLAPLCTFGVFRNRVLMRLFGQPCDDDKVAKALAKLPPLFAYLNQELEGRDYLVGDQLTIADIALGSQMVNFDHGGEQPDAELYPHLAAHTRRMHSLAPFVMTIEQERGFLKKMLG